MTSSAPVASAIASASAFWSRCGSWPATWRALARPSLALPIGPRPEERRYEPRSSQEMGADEHVLEHRVLPEERRRLERPRDAAPADLRRAELGDSLALVADLAGGQGDDAGDQVEDRALAGPVETDEAVDRAGHDRHRKIGDGMQAAEAP